MMQLPDDYNDYFNSDGSEKHNPYLDKDDGHILELEEAYIWGSRLNEIAYSLKSPYEREQYDIMRKNMCDKMNG